MNRFKVTSVEKQGSTLIFIGIVMTKKDGCYRQDGGGVMVSVPDGSAGKVHANLALMLAAHDVVRIDGLEKLILGMDKK